MTAVEPISNRLNAVNDASGRAFALWITFLTGSIYLAIAIGTTTHVQLLFGDARQVALAQRRPVVVRVLRVRAAVVPCAASLCSGAAHFLLRLLRLFNEDLKGAELMDEDPERVRDQLDTFVFTQMVIGASESWLVRQFLRIAVWLSFVIAPVLLLLAFQLQFLPYHSTAITWTHRVALLLDITMLWAMWPRISLAGTRPGRSATIARYVVRPACVLVCIILVAFSVGVATVPGEPIDTWEVAAGWAIKVVANGRRAVCWPTWVLFEGGADPVLGRAASIFSRNLVLIDAQLVEPDSDKLAKPTRTLSLRGRDLRFAILDRANLQRRIFTVRVCRTRRSIMRSFRARRSIMRSCRARRSTMRSFRARRSTRRSLRARLSSLRSYGVCRSTRRNCRARRSTMRSWKARRSTMRNCRARFSTIRICKARRSTFCAAARRVAQQGASAGCVAQVCAATGRVARRGGAAGRG